MEVNLYDIYLVLLDIESLLMVIIGLFILKFFINLVSGFLSNIRRNVS